MKKYIPALKWHWATPFYDFFIKITMPETEVKSKVIELAEIKPSECVLDFGFGTGTSLIMLANKYPDIKLFGFDVDEKIVEIAKEKFATQGVDVEVFLGDLAKIPSNSMDKIISTWVFHHLYLRDKIDALNELKRILKPNGLFVNGDWGKPQNLLMAFLFRILQLVDNFETTDNNLKGKLPYLILKSGFVDLEIPDYRNTLFGTLKYLKLKKI